MSEGIDVVVGLIETHGRADTEAMLKGLTVIRSLDTSSSTNNGSDY